MSVHDLEAVGEVDTAAVALRTVRHHRTDEVGGDTSILEELSKTAGGSRPHGPRVALLPQRGLEQLWAGRGVYLAVDLLESWHTAHDARCHGPHPGPLPTDAFQRIQAGVLREDVGRVGTHDGLRELPAVAG